MKFREAASMTIESRSSMITIGTLFSAGSMSGLSDGQLLERFLSRSGGGGEAAFAALVARHGPMVWDVCRAILSDSHSAEDAFQATFLVLAREARSIHRRNAVGPWLHGVARRVALRSRATKARDRIVDGEIDKRIGPVGPDPEWREQVEVLHEEIGRLPAKYRDAVVFCYFEGRTHADTASLLNCPVGTISVRLRRAREHLHARLKRRGLNLSGIGLKVGHFARAIPTEPAKSMIHARTLVATGLSMTTTAARLAGEVLRSMMLNGLIRASLFVGGIAAVMGVMPLAGSRAPVNAKIQAKPLAAPQPQPPAPATAEDRLSKPLASPRDDKPLHKFFGLEDRGGDVAYLIDRSGSMLTRHSLQVAKSELVASVEPLGADSRFAVLFYNLKSRVLNDDQGQPGLMPATESNKKSLVAQLDEIEPEGGTDHLAALREALALKPAVIFFLTDADLVTDRAVTAMLPKLAPTRIHVVQFGKGADSDPGRRTPLKQLAAETGGSFVYQNILEFP